MSEPHASFWKSMSHFGNLLSPQQKKNPNNPKQIKETFEFLKPIKCCCSQFIQINVRQLGTFKGNEIGGLSSDTLDIFCYDREVLLHRRLIAPHATVRIDFLGQGQDS